MKQNEIAKELYSMELGERKAFDNNSAWLRVPGGWVYGDMQGTIFIPFSDEFLSDLE